MNSKKVKCTSLMLELRWYLYCQ